MDWAVEEKDGVYLNGTMMVRQYKKTLDLYIHKC